MSTQKTTYVQRTLTLHKWSIIDQMLDEKIEAISNLLEDKNKFTKKEIDQLKNERSKMEEILMDFAGFEDDEDE